MYTRGMANKTISVPDDVLPIIDGLDMPFSAWVAEQLRRHAARSETSFGQQLLADARIADDEPPNEERRRAIAERMERNAPW